MNKNVINPWKWQDNFVQGIEISSGQHMLFFSGQTSVNQDGCPIHAGNMAAQINKSFDNIETDLHQADFQLSDIIQLKYYTTDVAAFSENGLALVDRLNKAGCKPSSTLLGVKELFHPDIMVKIEALAIKEP